jgi:hypothetical protein
VTSSAVITSLTAASNVTDAILATGEVTVEAWVTPAHDSQPGPARIIALSGNGFADGSNFMLGQRDKRYAMRFRTSRTNEYGSNPDLKGPISVATVPTHLVFTRNASGATSLYIDGVLVNTAKPGSSLASWDVTHKLTLANEPEGDYPWYGVLHLVAIYDFALSPTEVMVNFDESASAGDVPGCSNDLDCDDASFCNGAETCDTATGECTGSDAVCVDAAHCDESADVCVVCLTDSECDDGSFCNGTESCDPASRSCVGGEALCGDAAHCDELAARCLICIDDAECDDGSFCNGVETCVAGGCDTGDAPCIDAADCNEGDGICLQCLTDAECDDGLSCTTDSCVSGACNSASSCTPGTLCDVEQDLCVPFDSRVSDGLVVLYTFDEGAGETIRDNSGTGTPLDLSIADTAAVTWLGGSLELTSPAVITSSGAAQKVTEAVMLTGETTVEAWVTASNATQQGPARMVALSQNSFPDGSNFILGQEADWYTVRLRTTSTNQYGSDAAIDGPKTLQPSLTHVAFTRHASGETSLYIDGVLVETGNPGASLASWDLTHQLALGNESTGDQPWLGTLHLVAIYQRDLAAAEIAQNYSAGADAEDVLGCLLDAECDDGDFCNGAETCNSESGLCVENQGACIDPAHCDRAAESCFACSTDAECDDGVACTIDACVANICESTSSCNEGETCDSLLDQCTAPVVASPPLAPSGVIASPVSRNRIDLSWVDNSNNEETFEFERAVAELSPIPFLNPEVLGPFEPLASDIGADVIRYTDNSVLGATGYCYRVRSVNTAGASSFSEMACERTPECTLDSECNDADFCNGVETCDADIGLCQSGDASCADLAHCDEEADVCLGCIADAECDDGNFCNGGETCNGQTARCAAGVTTCDDEAHCDDAADACLGCIADAECDDGMFCNGAEFCDPVSSQCGPGATSCIDAAHCDEANDICVGCATDSECSDGTFCNGAETCNIGTGQCDIGQSTCADREHCDEAGDVCLECVADAECADASFCNGVELCAQGVCVDGVAACMDADHCDETAGICLECVSDADCSDGLSCSADTCMAGLCENASLCDSGQQCDVDLDECVEVVPVLPPLAPSDVTATAEAPRLIAVTWSDNSGNEEMFELQRAEVFISPIAFLNPYVLGPFETIAVGIAAETTSFADTTVAPGTGYCYRVRAVNTSATSEYSFWECDTTPFEQASVSPVATPGSVVVSAGPLGESVIVSERMRHRALDPYLTRGLRAVV